jgi:protein SHQ1
MYVDATMPLTPHFELSQTTTHVTVDIRVPHVRVSVDSVEIIVDQSTLHFSSPPYLLVLTFPAALVDNEEESAKYDPVKNGGMVSVTLTKQEPAIWPDLDLMGTLMAPKQPKSNQRGGIEILDESSYVQQQQQQQQDNEDIQQQETPSISDIRNALGPHYGFMNMHSGVFTDLAREGLAAEMLELQYPDTASPQERRELRLEKELEDFDCNRYLGDLDVEDDYIYQTAMNMKPHWQRHHETDETTTSTSFFTPEESAQLASIPYPLLPANSSPEQDESLLLGMLDILFAYVYDHIMTDGDPTIESSWTVCILSSALSWLDEFDSLELVVGHCIRRTLIYPYLRNYALAMYCWNQVACILKQKRRCIIRCLLQVRNILNRSECHYLGNRLFIDPYLVWIQRNVTDAQVSSLCRRLEILLEGAEQGKVLQKDSLGLDLLKLEQLIQEGSDDNGSSSGESEDGESFEEESSSSSDDSTDSSTDINEVSRCNDQRPAFTRLLDDEIGGSLLSLDKRLENLNLQMDTKAKEPKKLVEELN